MPQCAEPTYSTIYQSAQVLVHSLEEHQKEFEDNENVTRCEKNNLYTLLEKFNDVLRQLIGLIKNYLLEKGCKRTIVKSYDDYYEKLHYQVMNIEGGLNFATEVARGIVENIFHFPTKPLILAEECERRLTDNLTNAKCCQSVDDSNVIDSSCSSLLSSYDGDVDQRGEQHTCSSPRQRVLPGDGNPYISSASTTSLFRLPSLSDRSDDRIAISRYLHDSLVESSSYLPSSMTLAAPQGILRLDLCNPFEFFEAEFAAVGSQCDTCRCTNLTCGYRAVFTNPSNEGKGTGDSETGFHTGQFVSGRIGFDVCIPCACFFSARQRYYLNHCLRPPYQSFNLESAVVKVLRTCFSPSDEGGLLRLQCAIAPLGAVPIVWTLGRRGFEKEECCGGFGIDEPPRDWMKNLSITPTQNKIIAEKIGSRWRTEKCSVCLEEYGQLPVLLSSCGHLFHIYCIQDVIASLSNSCPLCREDNAFPPMSGEDVLKRNLFDIQLKIKRDEHPGTGDEYMVCVGALLRQDYLNYTNIGAAIVVKT